MERKLDLSAPAWAVRADAATESFLGMVGKSIGMMLMATLFTAFCVLLMTSSTFRIIVGLSMILIALLGPALAVWANVLDQKERNRIKMEIERHNNFLYRQSLHKMNNRAQS